MDCPGNLKNEHDIQRLANQTEPYLSDHLPSQGIKGLLFSRSLKCLIVDFPSENETLSMILVIS